MVETEWLTDKIAYDSSEFFYIVLQVFLGDDESGCVS